MTFTPLVMTAPEPDPEPKPAELIAATKLRQRSGCRIEIALSNGRRMIVEPDVDAAAVARLADALDPR